jgi:hypothetical protein
VKHKVSNKKISSWTFLFVEERLTLKNGMRQKTPLGTGTEPGNSKVTTTASILLSKLRSLTLMSGLDIL